MRRMSEKEFLNIKKGDTLYIKVRGVGYMESVAQGAPFWNADSDEPGREVETDNGFCDLYSCYKTDAKEPTAREILLFKTYIEMTPEEEKKVIEYETAKYKKRIEKLLEKHSAEYVENKIHDWWLDYLMHDDTEINLYHILEDLTKQ